MSAPYSMGLIRYGVPNVLSITSGILCAWAMSEIFFISIIFEFGFPRL